MIIDEIWNALLAVLMCIAYPFTIVAGIAYDFINVVYQTCYSSINIAIVAMDALLEIIRLGLALFVPAPILVGYIILLAIMVFAFFKRRLGEISVAGFKFGG